MVVNTKASRDQRIIVVGEDMQEHISFTSFPDLRSTTDTSSAASLPQQKCIVSGVQHDTPLDVLVISWAFLLAGYTGSASPVFQLDRRAIQVNLSRCEYSDLSLSGSHLQRPQYTAVYSQDALQDVEPQPSATRLVLWLPGGIDQSSCYITSMDVPLEALQQIGLQLDRLIRWRLAGESETPIGPPQGDLVMSKINSTPEILDGPRFLHHLVRYQSTANACAIEFRSAARVCRQLTYQDLLRRSQVLAARIKTTIKAKGKRDGVKQCIVPVLIPQSLELYVAILGVLEAGAAFCPLSLDAPAERLKFICQDVSADLVLSTAAHKSKIDWHDAPSLVLIDESSVEPGERAQSNSSHVSYRPTDLAYVMYTSGSSGTPKGVGVSHASATQALLAHDRHIPPFRRFLQFAAPTFDVFVFEMFFPLYRGCTLVGIDRRDLLNDLPGCINQMRVDAAELTPTVVGSLIQTRASVPRLKLLLTIGEMLTSSIVAEFGTSQGQEGILYGMYGPTEAAIHCTLVSKVAATAKAAVIGVPLDTASAYILAIPDPSADAKPTVQVLPMGYVGELAIGGHQLADGYLNRHQQTLEQFVETEELGRIYRTGDMARLLPDGQLEFLGRISSGQVKLRGQRIELGEIEQAACQTSGVNSALACISGATLVLFCLAEDGSASVASILATCKRWLPGFMVPGDVILTRDFARLPSGKVDKVAMETQYRESQHRLDQDGDNEGNETESRISACVTDILGHRIGMNTSFTAAGLDSLRVIGAVSRMRQQGLNLQAIDVLKADSISKLADQISRRDVTSGLLSAEEQTVNDSFGTIRAKAEDRIRDLHPNVPFADILPCAPVQVAMLAETAINRRAYVNWIELVVAGPSDISDIRKAFCQLVESNELLRTGFMSVEDAPDGFVQVVWQAMPEACFSEVSTLDHDNVLDIQDSVLPPLRVQCTPRDNGYRMFVTIHHALYDGWSWEHVLADFDRYLRGGGELIRPQYREVVQLYRRSTTRDAMKTAENYWANQLMGVVPCLLPNFNCKVDIPQGRLLRQRRLHVAAAQLETSARSLGVSQQTFVQAAFGLMLSAYLDSSEITFGTVHSGRTLPLHSIEEIIGPCLATVPIRLDVSYSRTGADLVLELHDANRRSLEHCSLPLRDIKGVCGMAPGRPLFDTLIVWQQTLRQTPEELRVVKEVDAMDYVEYALLLEIEPQQDQLFLRANFEQSILPSSQVELLLDQIDSLVTALVQSPTTCLESITSTFDERLMSVVNPSPQRLQETTINLAAAVERIASQNGDRVAIEFASSIRDDRLEVQRLTYSDLDSRANRVAHLLLSRGTCPDELICICMEKSVELYVSILGTIKAGAGYLPLTPDIPVERLQTIVREAGVRTCLASSASRRKLEDIKTIYAVYMDEEDLTDRPRCNPCRSGQRSDLAYAVYTSGSTGTPKGVLITQENLQSNIAILASLYPASPGSKMLQACSQAFDVSVFEIFFAWHTGMCLCSATNDTLFQDLERAIRLMQVTHLSMTPTVAALVHPDKVPAVQFLITSGEAVTPRVFESWANRGLWQGYGPSETTNICTVNPHVDKSDHINNLGSPLLNTSAFVTSPDDEFRLVPRGGVGEFCFGGDQVGRGYLEQPGLTAERFITHPRYGRLYRSGDFGRVLSNGSLIFVGRQDDQVKIRGHRVELGEINSVLIRSSQVADCFSTVSDGSSPSAAVRLVSFWVPKQLRSSPHRMLEVRPPLQQDIKVLYGLLGTALPPYMVPTALIPVTSLPMTAQGKIDRRHLLQALYDFDAEGWASVSRVEDADVDDEECSPAERRVAEAIQSVTHAALADVRRSTSFFSLGLDSISAIGVSKLLRRQGHEQVTVSCILANPTVAALAKAMMANTVSNGAVEMPRPRLDAYFQDQWLQSIKAKYSSKGLKIGKILPCTPLQEAMLSADQMARSDEMTAYSNHTVFNVLGDARRIMACWRQVVARHDILRTCFVDTPSRQHAFAQVVVEDHEPAWIQVEVSDAELDQHIEQLSSGQKRWDTEQEPPYGMTMIATPSHQVLMLSMHHALYDGVAIALLLAEVEDLYKGLSLGAAPQPHTFVEYMASLDVGEADKFWDHQMADFVPTPFPDLTGRPDSGRAEMIEARVVHRASTISLGSVAKSCKTLSVTLLALVQATWAKLLAAYLHEQDVCFGYIVSGRTAPVKGIDRMVFPCFNTIPLRARIGASVINVRLIQDLQASTSQALPFQLTPLRRIQARAGGAGKCLCDTLLILQQPQAHRDKDIWSVRSDQGRMDFPLVLEVVPDLETDVLQLILHVISPNVSEEDGQLIVRTFDSSLQSMLRYPSARALDFGSLDRELLSVSDSHRVLSDDMTSVMPRFAPGKLETIGTQPGDVDTSGSCSASNVVARDRQSVRMLTDDRIIRASSPRTNEHHGFLNGANSTGATEQWNAESRQLREVLGRLSGVAISRIGPSTTIYQLGLDSINAVQVAAQLREKGLQVTVSDVLEHPSVADLASHIQSSSPEEPSNSTAFDFAAFEQRHLGHICSKLHIDPTEVEQVRPCTSVQAGMIARFLHSEGHMYLNHVVVKLGESVDAEALHGSWTAVAQAYQMLRTGFTDIPNDQHGFAQITYRPDRSRVPWQAVTVSTSLQELLAKHRGLQTQEILKSPHEPPWRLLWIVHDKTQLLQFSAHHALYDAQSLQLLFNAVIQHYRSRQLPPVVAPDKTIGSMLHSADEDSEERIHFWRKLGQDMEIHRFPSLSPRRMSCATSIVLQRRLTMTKVEIESACQGKGISVQVAGQAAWARVLSAYLGTPSVTFGIVLSGRTLSAAAEGVAFPCIATLPLSCNVQGSIETLLQNLLRDNTSILKHQFTPLTKVQRSTDHVAEPLFDTLFAFQKIKRQKEEFRRPWTVVDEENTADYIISVELEEEVAEKAELNTDSEFLQLRLTCREDRVPRPQAEMLLSQLDHALQDTLDHGNAACDDMSRLPVESLSVKPAKDPQIPSQVHLLHEFVELHARSIPGKVAFEFATDLHGSNVAKRQWTYLQLDEEANRIAHLLLGHDAVPGDLIAICFDKCPEASFAMLGILKAGCAYVAVDPGAPMARKTFILGDSGAKLLLTTEDQAATLRERVSISILALDDFDRSIRLAVLPPVLARPVDPSDVCYCLYTSGTTGTPKGCEITHENAVQAILSFQRLFAPRSSPTSKFLQFASFHFDVSVLEHFWSWCVGASVASAPRDLILEDIAGTVRQLGITHMDLTPSLARTLRPGDVPSLCDGVFIVGGEPLTSDILDEWGHTGCIHNGYGPTEATIGCTMYRQVPADAKPSNIGPPFDNVGVFVFMPGTTLPVLRGGVGELCVSGKLVGRGYLRRPQLTEERFPILKGAGTRVYRTGDLVRLLHDDSVEFVGRADDQVKLRGQRLEIGEINSVIKSKVDGVDQVATLVAKHPTQQKDQLVTFVVERSAARRDGQATIVAEQEGNTISSQVLAACKAHLPPYMVPTQVVPLTSIPLSANNKADAHQLKDLYHWLWEEGSQQPRSGKEITHPEWSPHEEQLLDVIVRFTSVDRTKLTRDSNIFALGLDSITIIPFAQALRRNGMTSLAIAAVMQNPTVGLLAERLRQEKKDTSIVAAVILARQRMAAFAQKHTSTAVEALGLTRGAIEAVAPCTALQEGILVRSLQSTQPLYFESFYFELSPGVDHQRLLEAWNEVIAHHQILRARFVATPDGVAQAFSTRLVLDWEHIGRSKGGVTEPQTAFEQHWWQQNRGPIQTPLRLSLTTQDTRTIMGLHIFHALYDGHSLRLMLDEVVKRYQGDWDEDVLPAFLEVLPRGPLVELPEARHFWQTRLSTAKPSAFRSRQMSSMKVTAVNREFGVDELDATRRKLDTTVQALVQACWIAVLRTNYLHPPVVGVLVSGRSIDVEGIEKTIGPLFNTIPFYVELDGTETWQRLTQKCHQFNTEAIRYQHTPLRQITKWCKGSTSKPLFDTLFVFEREHVSGVNKAQELWSEVKSDPKADYVLSFEAHQMLDGRLKTNIVAQGAIVSPDAAEELLRGFEENMRHLIDDPRKSVVSSDSLCNGDDGKVTPITNGDGQEPGEINGVAQEPRWTAVASRIRDEIASLADVDPSDITLRTSIFELGLDSIDVIKLSSRLKRCDIRLAASRIMQNPVIGEMIQEAQTGAIDAGDRSGRSILVDCERQLRDYLAKTCHPLEDVESVLPVTPLQEAMLAQMVSSSYAQYFNHDILELRPEVSLRRLQDAWRVVVSRNPILRTSFREVDDPRISFSYAQLVHRPNNKWWRSAVVESEEPLDLGLGRIVEETTRHFADSQQEVPLRLTTIRYREEQYLVLSIAHALYDGWSLSLIHHDVEQAYHGPTGARQSYHSLLGHILDASTNEARIFWKDYLANAEGTHFPVSINAGKDRPVTYRMDRVARVSGGNVQGFCRAQHVTLQTLGQICWAIVLAWYVKKLQVSFGMVLLGRDTEEAQNSIFPTMNTVVINAVLHGSRQEMLKYMQENMAALRQHQHFPLRKAQALVGAGAAGLFSTLFIYQKGAPQLAGQEALYESIGSDSEVEYPVCVEMELVSEEIIWRSACRSDHMDSDEAQNMLEKVDHVLCGLVADSEKPLLEYLDDGLSICGLPPIALRELDQSSEPDGEAITTRNSEGWTDEEKLVRAVLADVSKTPVEMISKEMTIYHLGLDSISAIKVASQLRKRSVRVTVSEILRAGTIERMGVLISTRPCDIVPSPIDVDQVLQSRMAGIDLKDCMRRSHIEARNVQQMLPAVAGQTYMLAAWQRSRGTLFYPTFEYKVNSRLDRKQLDRAWRELLENHAILRTTFLSTDSFTIPYLQIVLDSTGNSVVWLDQKMGSAKPPHQVMDQATVTLHAHHEGQITKIRLQIHHAFYDGVSLPLLMRQLQDLYNGRRPAAVSAPGMADFVAYNILHSDETERKHFWMGYLAGISSTLIRPHAFRDHSTQRTEVFRPRAVDLTSDIEAYRKTKGLSIQSLFLAVYARVLSTKVETFHESIVFGLYLANRSHDLPGLSALAIPTVNLVPLRVKLAAGLSLSEMAQQIQNDLQHISHIQNSSVGLWEIREWTGITVDCFVNFIHLPDGEEEEASTSGDGDDVVFRPVGRKSSEETSEVVEVDVTGWEAPASLSRPDDGLLEAYPPSVDVEATIRGDKLDVGIFGPTAMLGLAAAERWIDEMRGLFEGMVEDGREDMDV
ncbi:MAG: NRPS [Caeruleum heppii]|nr:MAG: NRPS [Caeruleum heppii]